MHVGLDLGSTGARVLTVSPRHLQGKRTSLNYCLLPDTIQQRQHLSRAGIQFASCEGSLLLLGSQATEFARIFRTPPQSLLPFGDLPHHDILGRQILATHIDQLIPNRRSLSKNDPSDVAICCFSQPQPDPATTEIHSERERFLSQVLHLANYIPLPLSAGMGVVLAELVDAAFTGIVFVFGSSCSEMTIAYQGREIVRASAPVGGDWIDDELARRLDRYLFDAEGLRYPDLQMVRQWRERLTQPLLQPRTDVDQVISEVYVEYLTDAFQTCLDQCGPLNSIPDRSWLLVCAGGLTRTNGFKALAQRVLAEINFPFSILQMKLATQSDFTIARGCLANAFLEAQLEHQRKVA